ncbi:hypothetical protein BGW80DRAFT_576713 [Lactifluus volemus]|nr:hypothetical protein BGW80DRAFT_576713 [Lactifluus volemus]
MACAPSATRNSFDPVMPPLRDMPSVTSKHIPSPYHRFRSIHTKVPLNQMSSYSTLVGGNAFGESLPPHQQYSVPPSTHTITLSYPTADAASFGMHIPGPMLPVGGHVLSTTSSETSTSSGQGTAVVSPIALNVAAAEGQGPGWLLCGEPGCGSSFTYEQVRTRHFKNVHLPPGACPNCSWFKWPRGRPGLLTDHHRKYHMPSVTDD